MITVSTIVGAIIGYVTVQMIFPLLEKRRYRRQCAAIEAERETQAARYACRMHMLKQSVAGNDDPIRKEAERLAGK